jgi:hypothetical protein
MSLGQRFTEGLASASDVAGDSSFKRDGALVFGLNPGLCVLSANPATRYNKKRNAVRRVDN